METLFSPDEELEEAAQLVPDQNNYNSDRQFLSLPRYFGDPEGIRVAARLFENSRHSWFGEWL